MNSGMAGADAEVSQQPLVEPKLIKFLKNRPRLVDKGLREEFLNELEHNVASRRQPDTMAEKTVQNFLRRFEEAGGGVAKERVRVRMEQANETVLNNI